MKLRRAAATAVLLLLPALAHASGHRIEVFAGASYVKQSTLFGPALSAAYTIGHHKHDENTTGTPGTPCAPHSHMHWSVVLDTSFHFVNGDDHEHTIMAGPRFVFWIRDQRLKDFARDTTFVQVLLGKSHRENVVPARTNTAFALGVGWDHMLNDECNTHNVGLRLQADLIAPHEGKVYPRVSAGVVFRFFDKH